eukprot:3095740-Ditylum_brightwellii.AAC.1
MSWPQKKRLGWAPYLKMQKKQWHCAQHLTNWGIFSQQHQYKWTIQVLTGLLTVTYGNKNQRQ